MPVSSNWLDLPSSDLASTVRAALLLQDAKDKSEEPLRLLAWKVPSNVDHSVRNLLMCEFSRRIRESQSALLLTLGSS